MRGWACGVALHTDKQVRDLPHAVTVKRSRWKQQAGGDLPGMRGQSPTDRSFRALRRSSRRGHFDGFVSVGGGSDGYHQGQ